MDPLVQQVVGSNIIILPIAEFVKKNVDKMKEEARFEKILEN